MTPRIDGSPGRELALAPETKPAPSRQAAEAAAPERGEKFKNALDSLGHEIDRGEHLLHRALGGARHGSLSAGDLIALQAGIYKYSEAVDLAAKLVDRAGNALRTTLQGSGG